MTKFASVLGAIQQNNVIKLVILCVVIDTIFGFLRAVKEKRFNSNFGINGAIRKIGMLVSIVTLVLVDRIMNLNLIGFIPEQIRNYISLQHVGTAEFFGILYICYETVSILKNMTLCGLPVKKIWLAVRKFMNKYTDELVEYENEEE
ncbi:MAG: phage holin family protein [Lachnospiraceae bacterium]|nr:phage holin family protein [Lachnospiraceae bacterium]